MEMITSSESAGGCKVRQKLEDLTQFFLMELAKLSHEEANAIKTGDVDLILGLDKRIENMIGEKERAMGALNGHRAEHGC
jgi:hypothetical protein